MHGKCTQVRLVGSRDQFQFFIKKYIAFLIYFSGEILEFLKFCRLRQFPGTDYATTKGKAYLASMATLCKQSGIETIAEMVEDAELAGFLLECGITYGQGWYFGKPDTDHSVYAKK
ncbi:MAG: EAL domain-containing protein [Rhodospirillales bacterium]|jgi:c-di-GMP-related signal transduction protein